MPNPPGDDEIRSILTNLSWLDRCHCGQLPMSEFFVAAGRTMSQHALRICRTCPARRQEIIFAYERGVAQGYAGGLSPAQRAAMTLTQALAFAETETRNEKIAIRQEAEANATASAASPPRSKGLAGSQRRAA